MEKLTLKKFLELSKADLKGKVFCFPTDTVYGLSCLVHDKEAKKKIYEIKHRDKKPLAILCSNVSQISPCVKAVSKQALNLMNKYWPGGLTIIFEKSDLIESDINTIAFRMPDSQIALKIIDHFGLVYATSVNYSGEKELSSIEEIATTFPKIDYLITDYEKMESIPSTIVDATHDLKVIRQGKLIV